MRKIIKAIHTLPKPVLFTRDGFEKMKAEYEELEKQRPHAVSELKRAREMGDLSENGFYKGARAKLSQVDSRLRHLKELIKRAEIKEKTSSDVIEIGTTVMLFNGTEEVTYTIVGGFESNPSEGRISHVSPLGSQLIGKKTEEKIIIITPGGKVEYIVKNIS